MPRIRNSDTGYEPKKNNSFDFSNKMFPISRFWVNKFVYVTLNTFSIFRVINISSTVAEREMKNVEYRLLK